jgi:hypothetical protein
MSATTHKIHQVVDLFQQQKLGADCSEACGCQVILALLEHVGLTGSLAKRQYSTKDGKQLNIRIQYGVRVDIPNSKRGMYIAGDGQVNKNRMIKKTPSMQGYAKTPEHYAGTWEQLPRVTLLHDGETANRIELGKQYLDSLTGAQQLQETTSPALPGVRKQRL